MYAWIWRHLPGQWPAKLGISLALVAVIVLVLWYVAFPWAEARIRFDHGVVDSGTSSPAPRR